MTKALVQRRAMGIPVHDRHDDWLTACEHASTDNDVVRVRHIGADPFA